MKQFNPKNLYTAFLSLAFILLIFNPINAQDSTPTPTPTPKKKLEELKDVNDKQDVQPEAVKGVPQIAPKYKSDDRKLPDIGRVGVDMTMQKTLALRDAIVRALENNKDIEVSRKDVEIAEFDVKAADGGYEPIISGQTFFQRQTNPNVSIFSSNTSTTDNALTGSLSYQGFIKKYGTVYSAEFSSQRVSTDNTISLLSPQINESLKFSITQPLFRGRRFDSRRRAIEIAKRNLSLTDTQFRQKAIEITATVQRAYWDLTFALKNLQVQRDGVRDAKEQLEHNKRLVKEGVLAPIDIVAAETQVANLEQNVYVALETVNRAENILKNLIAENRNEVIWSYALIPTDRVKLDVPRTNLKEALEVALENRPELELNKVASDINKIDQKFYREQDKPKVDFTASFTTSGIAGNFNNNFETPFQPTECQPDPTTPACQAATAALNASIRQSASTFTGNRLNVYADMLRNRYPTYQAGITFNLPLFGNRTTKAQFGKTLAQASRLKLQREQIEQLIQMDVRNALQSVITSEARLRSAAISRENSEKQYASEKRKLNAGLSDIYKVLERQTALMNAKSIELQAQTELNKAIAELQRATGNSLKANNVETSLRR